MKIPSVVLQLFEILSHIQPVSQHKIFFTSFHGQYNDNPKAISTKLHEKYPQVKIYWEISDKSKQNDIPEYVTRLQSGTFKLIWFKNQCKVIVDNGAGYYLLTSNNKVVFWLKKTFLKNKKQFNLSTWHGNPIKHIGAQIPSENWSINNTYSSSDMLIAGCVQIKNIFERAFLNLMPIKLLGTPRTDLLFNEDDNLKRILKKKLGLPSNKNILLYAPTYRYSRNDSGIIQMRMIDFERLFTCLHDKFDGEWIFVMRVHNMVLMELSKTGYLDQYKGVVYDGNLFDDMNEYLYVADVLLTDYSGCIYDVALTNKPCFLFSHDRRNYEEKERGLYTQLSEFPYSFSDSFNELINNIKQFDQQHANKLRLSFLQKIGNIEDGSSSSRIIEEIIKHSEV